MGEAKHTPGPWTTEGPRSMTASGHVWSSGRLVAGCQGYTDGKKSTVEENIANAHLIAACPTMFDALIAIRSQCMGHADEFSRRVWEAATTAIAKAEGRTDG